MPPKKTNQKKSETEPLEELQVVSGSSGTNITSGMIDDDYNPNLNFPKSVEIFDEMRRSDGTVIGMLRAMKNPLLSAEWEIVS